MEPFTISALATLLFLIKKRASAVPGAATRGKTRATRIALATPNLFGPIPAKSCFLCGAAPTLPNVPLAGLGSLVAPTVGILPGIPSPLPVAPVIGYRGGTVRLPVAPVVYGGAGGGGRLEYSYY